MKFEEAKRIGVECGLETPEEWILNIEHHALNLFIYTNITSELEELHNDAAKLGYLKRGDNIGHKDRT